MNYTMVLMASAVVSAVLHTLVPDHEIPLALIGRTQNWSMKKLAAVTLVACIIHISVSIGVGTVAVIASATLSQFIANSAQQISGMLLVAFGVVYMCVSSRRKQGGHWHSHGQGQQFHMHDNEEGLHHVDHSVECTKVRWSTLVVAIVGIAPCFTLIPVLIAAVPYGVTTTLLVMASYAVATVGMMLVLTLVAFKAIDYVMRLHRIERHAELLAGLVIAAVGIWLILEVILGL